MLPTHSHSGTKHCLEKQVLYLIAMKYLGSSEDHNEYIDCMRQLRRVILKGVSLLFGLFRLVLVNPGNQGFQVYNYCKCSFK